MYLNYIHVYYVSSPYLLVFGDDRVYGTREHMMLQVALVRHRLGAEARLRKSLSDFFMI